MRIIFFMLYFLSVSYTASGNDHPQIGDDLLDGDGDSRIKEGICITKEDHLKLKYNNRSVPSECSCERHNDEQEKVEQCFNTYICKEQCKDYIRENANYCDNIPNNRNNENALCQERCDGSSPNFSVQSFSQSSDVTDCVRENRRKLQDQLVESCRSRINNIENSPPHTGATLVCPGGAGCERYCQSMAQEKSNNIQGCKKVTTKDVFDQCLELNNRLSHVLPQNSSQLPQGFAWENCDLGKTCDQEIQVVFNNTHTACENLKTQAVLCCEKPLECGDEQMATLFNSVDKFNVQGGMSEICRKAGEKFSDVGEAGRKMAEQCNARSSSCLEICRQKIENINVLLRNICTFDLLKESFYNPERHTCSGRLIDKYVRLYKQHLEPVAFQCKETSKKSTEIASMASEILKSALSSANCDLEARAGMSSSGSNTVSEKQHRVPEAENLRAGSAVSDSSSLKWGGASKTSSESSGGGGKVSKDTSSALNNKVGTFSNSGGGGGGWSGYDSNGDTSNSGLAGRGVSNYNQNKGDIWSKMQGSLGKDVEQEKEGEIQVVDKTKSEKEGEDAQVLEEELAGAFGAENGQGLSWDKIKPDNVHKRVSSFGSLHDDIFKRISDRIFVMCSTDKLIDCKGFR